MDERLPDDLADVLDLLLTRDDATHRALRAQLPHVRVRDGVFRHRRERCGGAGAGEHGRRGRGAAVRAGRRGPGEVLVFTQRGYRDDMEVTVEAARTWLRSGRSVLHRVAP
ncbi:hypothetical protein GCM10010218_27470 [Streptomyces mashuensis]|uniref:Uncharacterized protein n=1 Tax=Streptomyces mashuensis TaxID=33904 RepID=A0A919B4B8_9ACTN|nr:hypothetical protein [Streptomyces mashuensis]GHF44568.1 hypothetical protein GCM10010218_27470 [Streptomyces mashuensis]